MRPPARAVRRAPGWRRCTTRSARARPSTSRGAAHRRSCTAPWPPRARPLQEIESAGGPSVQGVTMSFIANIVIAVTLASGTVDDGIKSGTGVVQSVDAAGSKAIVRTPAGPVTFITSGAKGLENLEAGKSVELRFFVNDGARLTEVSPATPAVVVAPPPPLTTAWSTAGTLASIDNDGTRITVLAPAGLVTLQATKELTLGLPLGQDVRVWHTGNVATKVDVLTAAQKPKAVSQLK